MKAIFQVSEIPESFKIAAINHPFGYGPLDGPPPVTYKATVAGSDYPVLVRELGEKQDLSEADLGRDLGAFFVYERDRSTEFLKSISAKEGDPYWEDRYLLEYFESPRDGNFNDSAIVCDVTTSDPVTLYITTYYPYKGR